MDESFTSGPPDRDDRLAWVAVDGCAAVVVTGGAHVDTTSKDFLTIKYSADGFPLWTNRYNGPGNGEDEAFCVAVDGEHNVVVCGASSGAGTGSDACIIKLSSAGAALWTNRYSSLGNQGDWAGRVAVDSRGNVILAGGAATSSNRQDFLTIKYSPDGIPLWTNFYDGPGHASDSVMELALDGEDNVVVAGISPPNGVRFSEDYAIIKYSREGIPLWTNRYNGVGDGHDVVQGLGVDGAGNIFVTGGAEDVRLSDAYAFITIKYSSSGVGLWTNRFKAAPYEADIAAGLAVDSQGDVFVVGISLDGTSGYDYLTIKYASDGTALWTNRFDRGATHDEPKAIAVDALGKAYVTGSSSGMFATVAYAGDGTQLWTEFYQDGYGYHTAYGLAADCAGVVYVAGVSQNGLDNDYATIRYSTGTAMPRAWLQVERDAGAMILSWTNGMFLLESAPGVLGPYAEVAESSPYTNLFNGSQAYFRLRSR